MTTPESETPTSMRGIQNYEDKFNSPLILWTPWLIILVTGLLISLPVSHTFGISLLGENQLVELLTFVGFILGGIQGLTLARAMKQQGSKMYIWGFYVLFSLGLLFVGMEEISWGQWFLGFGTPQVIGDINTQNELNLHNLTFWQDHLEIFPLIFGLGGILGVWLASRRGFEEIAPRRILLPWFGIIAGVSAVDFYQDFIIIHPALDNLLNDLDEVIEMMVGISALLFVWMNTRRFLPKADLFSMKIKKAQDAFNTSWSARLLTFLLTLDGVFIAFHFLYMFTESVNDAGFSLETDQGYAEFFQYIKYVWISVLFWTFFKHRRSWLDLHWLFLFIYLFLDDALLIHETAGAWLANQINLPAFFSIEGYYWGELLIAMAVGFFFLSTLLLSYQMSDSKARRSALSIIFFLSGLVFFGVVIDLIHAWVTNPWLAAWLGLLEDGGEMIFVSLITWFLAREAAIIQDEERTKASIQIAVQATTVFGACALLFGILQFSTAGLVGNDGYYHAKMGLLIHQHGPKPTPPQLPYTILNEENFYDHHFLYHVYLGIFARVDPQIDGGIELTRSIKVASIWLPSLAFVAIWWLLRNQGVPWASLWTLGLFAISGDFLFRMSMPRTQSASLLILALGLHWLYQKRYTWLGLLGFVYVWTYNAFPLLLVISGTYVLATWMTERRWAWQALVFPIVGITLGLVINPYFPKDLSFILYHIFPKTAGLNPAVGDEWFPYETWTLVQDSGWALVFFLFGVFSMAWREKRPNTPALTAFFLTIVFGLMMFKAQRFIEYFPAFVLIFAALTIPYLHIPGQSIPSPLRNRNLVIVLVLLIFPLFKTLHAAQTYIRHFGPPDLYASASLWLNVYAEPGSTVYQVDWDDFTRLFFYDSDKIYTIGLDPTFMELQDPDLYEEWVAIQQGEVLQPGTPIRDDFGGDYVFSDLDQDNFLIRAFQDSSLEEIYRDDYAIIFKVLEDPK